MTFQRSATRTERKGRDPVPDRNGTRGSTSWRASPSSRRPHRPRRVGPSVPDIAPRPRDHRGFAAARPEFFVRLFSGGNSRPGKSGVHYTQLDARVASRYVRQTALLLTSPYLHRTVSLLVASTLCSAPCARFPSVTLIGPSFLFILYLKNTS